MNFPLISLAGLTFIRLEEGKLVLFRRAGIWQARMRIKGQYIWRSLGTSNESEARRVGLRMYYQLTLRADEGLPLHQRTLNVVIDEYVAARERSNRLNASASNGRSGEYTSDGMLRQIKRVARFWREYAGTNTVDSIDNKVLAGYVEWRREYYRNKPALPKNAKLNPTDKTLQWEIMQGKAFIKFAHDRGYRGGKALPTFTFVPKTKRVRPALTLSDFERLLGHLPSWLASSKDARQSASRQLLSDYVRTLALSGLRVGELNNMRIGDVEEFTDSAGRQNVQLRVMKGKTGQRIVVPHVEVREIVRRALSRRTMARSDDLLFPMPAGGQIITLADQFDALLKDAGMPRNTAGEKFTLYSLRHFYAVRQIANGTDIYTIAKNMGTSVAMIEQYYAKHATPPERAAKLGGERGCYYAPKRSTSEIRLVDRKP